MKIDLTTFELRIAGNARVTEWYVWSAPHAKKGDGYIGGPFSTSTEARIWALQETARNYQAKIDQIDEKLRDLGAFDEHDPHGYMA